MGPSTLEEALIGQVALDHTLPVGFLATACPFPSQRGPRAFAPESELVLGISARTPPQKNKQQQKPATVSPSCYKVYQLLVAGKGGYADFRQTATAFRVPTSPKN